MRKRELSVVVALFVSLKLFSGEVQSEIFSDARSVAEEFAKAVLSADYEKIGELACKRGEERLTAQEAEKLDLSWWASFKGVVFQINLHRFFSLF